MGNYKYNPKEIEPKWQQCWEKHQSFKAEDNSLKEKKFILVEFPYPSGAGLHVGHVRSYTALDVYSRLLRLQGFNVLYPMGWDAFGLPTENYAIKHKIKPQQATKDNIEKFKKQLKSLGLSYDWSREINTTSPSYYKWTQWIFLQLYKKGLAYKHKMPINWCPSCKTGLANEEVIDGKCERCGAQTEKKEKEQWMLKITEYADRLIEDLETVDFLEKIKMQQINWIGRSEGAEITFNIEDKEVKVFTTRPDTIFGATYLVLAPEHELVSEIVSKEQKPAVEDYLDLARKKSDLERTQLQKDKTGVFTGAYAVNPATKEKIPVWVADYVLASYGFGAIMSVPAHDDRDFDFAKKYNLAIKEVVKDLKDSQKQDDDLDSTFTGEGEVINSDFLTGLTTSQAKAKIITWLEENNLGKKTVNYKLRDWIFSRQHYWGEPIPIVYCKKCGEVPVPEENLPITLPEVENYEPTDTGESPLAKIASFVNTVCPKCQGEAKRETDTMPNWAGSSWYWLRYTDPQNDRSLASKEKMNYWLPVDLYNGGMEHTTLHLLYSRFWNKFLYDIGIVPSLEPYKKRISHGMILAEDGRKMSKSFGNVINPDDMVEKYGADSLRLFEMFVGPFSETIPWSEQGLSGCRKFLDKVFNYFYDFRETAFSESDLSEELLTLLQKTVKKVGEDIKAFKFNTAVSALMILFNELKQGDNWYFYSLKDMKKIAIILYPLAPHLASEVWSFMEKDNKLEKVAWPQYDDKLIAQEKINLIVQVNGKLRATLTVEGDIEESQAKQLALKEEAVKRQLEGKEIKKVIFVPGRLINFVV
ncbi:MAG: leucine--tRNA ligase [Candidatus Pacebacteria bacterium]|nr:leucine--tRNA ligase [Candidatus Paceibacterota bacterium]